MIDQTTQKRTRPNVANRFPALNYYTNVYLVQRIDYAQAPRLDKQDYKRYTSCGVMFFQNPEES